MQKEIKTRIKISIALVALVIGGYSIHKNSSKIELKAKFDDTIAEWLDINQNEEFVNYLADAIENNDYYNEKNYVYNTNKEELLKKIGSFFSQYGKYFTGHQVYNITNKIASVSEENKLYTTIYEALLAEIRTENEISQGIEEAFVTAIVKEYCGAGTLSSYNNYDIFNQLIDRIGREKAIQFFVEKDTDGFIDSLKEAYHYDTTEEVLTILNLWNEYNNPSLETEERQQISTKIEEQYTKMLKHYYEQEETMHQSLYGKIIAAHVYEKKDDRVYFFYDKDTVTIRVSSDKYGNLYLYDIEASTLNEPYTYEELLNQYANKKLAEYYSTEDTYDQHTINVLSYIIDWDTFSKFSVEDKISLIWKELSPYFSDKNEMTEFIIGLMMRNKEAYEEFFTIFKERLLAQPPTMETLAELKSLEQYYHETIYIHLYPYDSWGNDKNMYEMERIPKESEEAQEYYTIVEDYSFGEVNPDPYFQEIHQYCEQGDLPFYNTPDSLYEIRDWKTGQKEYALPEKISVYSQEVVPVIEQIENYYVVYYKIPMHYETGEAIQLVKNLKDEEIEMPVSGIVTTTIEEETQTEENVFITYYNLLPPEEPKPIIFKVAGEKIIAMNKEAEEENKLAITYK